MQAGSSDTVLQGWLRWLENTGVAVTVRESAMALPGSGNRAHHRLRHTRRRGCDV